MPQYSRLMTLRSLLSSTSPLEPKGQVTANDISYPALASTPMPESVCRVFLPGAEPGGTHELG
jgi:hypothetical protein